MIKLVLTILVFLNCIGELNAKGGYTFSIANGKIIKKCKSFPGGIGLFLNAMTEIMVQDKSDLVSFRGRLTGTVGKYKAGESLLVFSDSKSNCDKAMNNIFKISDQLNLFTTRTASQIKQKRNIRNSERLLLDIFCYQTPDKSTCTTRKMCKFVEIQSTDVNMPLNIKVPCETLNIFAE